MTRLEACIEALEAKKCHYLTMGSKSVINVAIAIVTRILSAEPSEEEIDAVAIALSGAPFPTVNSQKKAKAALMTVFGQKEKI